MAKAAGKSARASSLASARMSKRYAKPARMTKATGQVSAFPQSIRTKLYYSQHDIDVIAGAGAVDQFRRFRLTNPSDPDQTGTGHQPLGWDEYTKIYEDCWVIACAISVQIACDEKTEPLVITLRATDADSLSDDVFGERENSNCVYRTTPSDGSQTITYLSQKVDVPQFIGKSYQEYISMTDYAIKTTSGTYSPVEQLFWNIGRGYSNPSAPADNNIKFHTNTVLEYDVLFTNPRKLEES